MVLQKPSCGTRAGNTCHYRGKRGSGTIYIRDLRGRGKVIIEAIPLWLICLWQRWQENNYSIPPTIEQETCTLTYALMRRNVQNAIYRINIQLQVNTMPRSRLNLNNCTWSKNCSAARRKTKEHNLCRTQRSSFLFSAYSRRSSTRSPKKNWVVEKTEVDGVWKMNDNSCVCLTVPVSGSSACD